MTFKTFKWIVFADTEAASVLGVIEASSQSEAYDKAKRELPHQKLFVRSKASVELGTDLVGRRIDTLTRAGKVEARESKRRELAQQRAYAEKMRKRPRALGTSGVLAGLAIIADEHDDQFSNGNPYYVG